MTHIPLPIDPATLAVWMQEREKINEIRSPESTPKLSIGNGTYYFTYDQSTLRDFGVDLSWAGLTDGTATISIEATRQDDGTAFDLCQYQDYTFRITGQYSIIVNGGSSGIESFIVDQGLFSTVKYVRIKVVIAGATTTDWSFTDRKISVAL